MKKLFCLLLTLAAMAALIMPAAADKAAAESGYSAFEGKSWDEIVEDFLEEKNIRGQRLSLGYYNTVTGEEHYYNGDELRTGASIYKLPLMMYFAEELYLGEIDRDTPIGPYDYDTVMYHAIRYSSNPAGEAMQSSFDSYKDYKTAIGKFLDIGDLPEDSPYYSTNEFSARMMISCLKYLYADPDRYPDLLDSLLHTERGEYLGYSEDRYDIAHKLGYLDTEQHTYFNDCGIVYTEQPILLVALTDNIYGGVGSISAWCTLMCDYTNYTASLPAPTAEATPEPTPEATPAPTLQTPEIPSEESAGTEAAARGKVLLACCAAAVLLAVGWLALSVRGRSAGRAKCPAPVREHAPARAASYIPELRAARPLGVIALCCAALTVGLCVYASGAEPRIVGDPGDPGAAAAALLEDIRAGNYDGAKARFISGTAPELGAEPETDAARLVWTALSESYDYSLGEVYVDGIYARQAVTLSRVDLAAVDTGLRDAVKESLARLVEDARYESEIYGDDGEYLPAFIARALDGALLSLLDGEETASCLGSADFTLTLVYEKGEWRALWNDEFALALSGGAVDSAAKPAAGLDMYMTNSASAALSGIAKIEKIYTLPEELVVAPEPDQSRFGTAGSPEEISALLASAADLLDGQETALSPDTPVFGGGVSYYLDETIFAACWKEQLGGCVYTFSEVRVAHPSQFRRMIGGDAFGSELLYHPSDMAAGCNAVVAVSGDYYAFRNMGIVVYHGELYRTRGDYIDSCMVDRNGDLHFVYARDIATEQEALDYIAANDIRFSLVFGPVLVDGGEIVHRSAYPLGEVKDRYSRCGFGQLGELHYLLATANGEGGFTNVPDIDEFAAVFHDKGCRMAYTLDGGQTGTMVMNDQVMNSVTFGYQRNISDILYFATALPEKGGERNG